MRIRFLAEETTGADLKPGDLFSTAGPAYWDNVDASGSIGEKVYVRTNTPASRSRDDPNSPIYRITTEEQGNISG